MYDKDEETNKVPSRQDDNDSATTPGSNSARTVAGTTSFCNSEEQPISLVPPQRIQRFSKGDVGLVETK